MSSILLSGPTVEPVSLAEAKAFLRVEHDDDDDTVAALIAGARVHVEAQTRRALIAQSWRLIRDSWPGNGRIAIAPAPLRELTAARVYRLDGSTQEIDPAAFAVDAASAPAVLSFASGAIPAPGRVIAGIELDVEVGYGEDPADVPEPLRQAIRVLVAHWYENRGLIAAGGGIAVLPQTVAALIAPYRVLSVIDRDLSEPPAEPNLGDRYLVKSPGAGDFDGMDDRVAQFDTGGWNFYAPREGWTCYVCDEHTLLAWDGESWGPALDMLGGVSELQDVTLLGIGSEADATNPLSARLNNVLWAAKTEAQGGDGTLRYKLSKESAEKNLSFLFQDDFSGRAEIGLTGDDDFHFKVSADGEEWLDAIVIDHETGEVSFPHSEAPGGISAGLDIVLAELAMGLADALNVAQFLGDSGNRFADSFDALTYVDAAGAANLNTGTAGQLKPSTAAGTITYSGSNPPATSATAGWGSSTYISESAALPNGATIASIGVYCDAATTFSMKIVKKNSSTSVDVVVSQPLTHPGGGWADLTLTTPYVVPGSGSYYAGAAVTGADPSTKYNAGDTKLTGAGSLSGSGQAVAESAGAVWSFRATEQGTTSNLTVASTALTAAAVPSSLKIVAQVEETDSITLGTDLIISVSRDGGATWTNATMNERFTANSIHVLESDAIDVSGQPSGTDIKWRITTDNNKAVKIHGIFLYWT